MSFLCTENTETLITKGQSEVGWWQLKYFLMFNVHPEKLGKISHFDEHIFQMG